MVPDVEMEGSNDCVNQLSELVSGMRNMHTGYCGQACQNICAQSATVYHQAAEKWGAKPTLLPADPKQSLEEFPTADSAYHSALPWRDYSVFDAGHEVFDRMKISPCQEINLDPKLNSHSDDEMVPTGSTWMTSLKVSFRHSPAADRRMNKLTCVHSEAEYSMHHQEHDYAHHKHYLQQHHYGSSCFHYTSSRSSPLSEEHVEQTGNLNYLTPSDPVNEPHFREIYPHYHHHYHHNHHHHQHHSLRGFSFPIKPSDEEDISFAWNGSVCEGLGTQANLRMETLQFCDPTDNTNSNPDFHGAWHRLKVRVLAWLDSVQGAGISVLDDPNSSELGSADNSAKIEL
ncbi:unnamed protein product [Dicrocoelium dendriticum]|nr:unnamed protein product [Dicrocoelium dendriticum]